MNRRRKSCYRPYEGKRWPLWRKAVLALLLAGALAFGALFGAVMYGAYDHIQGEPRLMVILGCQVKPWGPSILLQDRLDKALDYLEEHPDVQVVVSGGQGPGEDISEAEAMKRYLLEKGVDESRLYMEDKSTNTFENIQFSKRILEEHRLSPTVVIATQEFHQYRAQAFARRAGLTDAGPCTCHTPPYLLLCYWVREFAAISRMLLLGY